jgi:hypothetical protein
MFKDIRDRNKELQEENKTIAEQIKSAQDPQEKARLVALLNQNKKEIADNNRTMAEQINKMNKNFEGFGRTPMSQEQFQAKATQPNLSSWKS